MNVRLLLITVFGLGHLRPASGTWGSTPPVAFALLLIWVLSLDGLSVHDQWIINISLVLIGLIFSIVCVRFGAEAEQCFAKKDPGQVVADETAGQCIALLFLPWRPMTDKDGWIWNLVLAGTAFFAFRILDIIKPPPANQIQRLAGGWGILADDLIAGAYALIVAQGVGRVLLPMSPLG
ncbi:MAG: phosphatidylglycerophosphatase A [Planctomycetes bacterium]|nr:phosphatidylglycerophosphatase A [Planctomycetota bacterium]